MLVLDLDGTLLDSRERISRQTIEAIAAVNQLGIQTVIATGRHAREAMFAVELSGVKDFLIEMNGSKITDLRTGKVLYEECFDFASAIKLLECLGDKYVFQIYTNQGILCTDHSLPRLQEAGMSEYYLDMFGSQINSLAEADSKNLRIYKLLIIEKNPRKIQALFALTEKISGIECVNSMQNYYEIILSHINKQKALEMLCKKLKISPSSVMAIGDSENDREMLTFAGTGVVLANANADLRQEINQVFPSNDEEGVLQAIEACILKKESE